MTESCCIMCVLHVYDLRSFSFSRQKLFVFVFGRILQWTIRYSAEYWKTHIWYSPSYLTASAVSFSNYISRHHIDCHCCWLDGRSSSGNCRWDNVLKLNPLLAVVAYDMQKITVKLRHNYGANRLVLTCYFTAIHQMMATKPVCCVAFLSRISVFWYYDIFDTSLTSSFQDNLGKPAPERLNQSGF